MSLPNFHQLRESQNQPLNLLGTKNGTPMYDKNYFTNKNKILLRTKKVTHKLKIIVLGKKNIKALAFYQKGRKIVVFCENL